jgi:hypothetical protein
MTHDYEDILKNYDNWRRLKTTESGAAKYDHTVANQDWISGKRDMAV